MSPNVPIAHLPAALKQQVLTALARGEKPRVVAERVGVVVEAVYTIRRNAKKPKTVTRPSSNALQAFAERAEHLPLAEARGLMLRVARAIREGLPLESVA